MDGNYSPKPGTVDSWNCDLCGTKAVVKRNVHGPTGFAEAMAKKGHLHDSFRCPHIEEPWHEKARKIKWEVRETASDRLSELLMEEVNSIIALNLESKQ